MSDIWTPAAGIPVWADIARRAKELEARDYIAEHAPEHIREDLLRAANRSYFQNADGIYYQDTKMPFFTADDAAVSFTTGQLVHTIQYTSLPANYFTPGKLLQLSLMGRATTAATPGNLTIELRYGTTSGGGTILATSQATALTANKTNITWIANFYVRCRTIGATGTLLGWGTTTFEQTSAIVTTAANNPVFAPITAPAATTVDTTGAQGINVQWKRSGSTAESVTVHDLAFSALN